MPCVWRAGGQVLLLPNFTMCVTSEMRSVDGFDTIELLEQVDAALARVAQGLHLSAACPDARALVCVVCCTWSPSAAVESLSAAALVLAAPSNLQPPRPQNHDTFVF